MNKKEMLDLLNAMMTEAQEEITAARATGDEATVQRYMARGFALAEVANLLKHPKEAKEKYNRYFDQ